MNDWRAGFVTEGRASPLVNPRRRTQTHHIVAILIDLKARSYFAHVSTEQIIQRICAKGEPEGFHFDEWQTVWPFIGDYKANLHETFYEYMPCRSLDAAVQHVSYKYGIRCAECKQVFFQEPDFSWDEHGVCEDCIIQARAAGWRKIKQRRDEAAFKRRLLESEEQRASKRETIRKAQVDKRRAEKAAYELLLEMGLLDKIKVPA